VTIKNKFAALENLDDQCQMTVFTQWINETFVSTCFDLYINHFQVLTIKHLTYKWMLHNVLHS
jgi:hypothetical protein